MSLEKYEYYRTKLGKLYHGDCLDLMSDISDGSVDLTVTSPPYDNLRTYNDKLVWNWDIFSRIADHLFRVTKQGGVVVWVVGDATINGSETGTSFKQALYFKKIGFNLHDTMIYLKTGFNNPSSNRYHQVFEYMFVFSKGTPKTFNSINDRINFYKKRGGRSIRQKNGTVKKGIGGQILKPRGMRFNVWEVSCPGVPDTMHPAIFPIQIPKDHTISWSNKNDIILDPFLGSGTTAIACERLNRKWIGIEISEDYCEIAARRIEKENEQLKLFG